MQALLLNNGLTYRADVPQPTTARDEALIRMRVAGICATDIELVNGYAAYSGIIGHEFVGIVEAVGDTKHRHRLHQRVVGSINIACHCCAACDARMPEHCLNRKVLGIRGHDGVFADYFILPVANLYAVPDEITDEAAVFTEPLAAAIRVRQQLQSTPFRTVAVIGPGRLGLLIAKVLALADYEVLVLGRSAASLVLPGQWQLKTARLEAAADHQFECVVDATGQASGFKQALRIIKPRGTLILKSTFSALEPVDLNKVVVAELNIQGSRCGPFAEALSTLQQHSIALETMIDGRYTLANGIAALRHAAQPGVRKILLTPGQNTVEAGASVNPHRNI